MPLLKHCLFACLMAVIVNPLAINSATHVLTINVTSITLNKKLHTSLVTIKVENLGEEILRPNMFLLDVIIAQTVFTDAKKREWRFAKRLTIGDPPTDSINYKNKVPPFLSS